MTQHPNPPLGGDEAKVEPVAWRWRWVGKRQGGEGWAYREVPLADDIPAHMYEVQPLYAASVLPVEVREAARRINIWIKCGMPDQSDNTPARDLLKRHLELVLSTIKGDA